MTRLPIALPFALLAAVVAGCGGSTSGSPDASPDAPSSKGDSGNTKHDGGTGGDTGTKHEGGTKDTGTKEDTGVDAGGADAEEAGVTPVGTSLVKGLTEVIGVTTDQYLIYVNGVTAELDAIPLAGGSKIMILAGGDAGASNGPLISLDHNVVTVVSNYNAKDVGTTSIWTTTHQMLTQVSTSSIGLVATSADSKYAILTDAMNADGTIGNLVGINTDGTSPMTLEKSVDLNEVQGSTCIAVGQFDQAFAVVEYCPVTDGGITGQPIVTAYNTGSAWAPQVLQTNALATTTYLRFATDDAGINALTIGQEKSDAGATREQVSIVGLASGTAVPLTANGGVPPAEGIFGGVPTAYLSGGSQYALYSVFSNGLTQATFANPQVPVPAPLAITDPTDAAYNAATTIGVAAVSPDNNWAITYEGVDTSIQVATSLYVQSLTPSGGAYPAAQQVSTNSPVFPLGFTADGTYMMFSSHLVSNGIMSGLNQGSVGDLRSAQLKAGTTPVVVDSQLTVWNATGTHGTKIVYNTNYNGMVPYAINGTASADLYNADASQASTGTLIITGADANYYLTADKTHLIYSLSAGAMSDGVYSYAVP